MLPIATGKQLLLIHYRTRSQPLLEPGQRGLDRNEDVALGHKNRLNGLFDRSRVLVSLALMLLWEPVCPAISERLLRRKRSSISLLTCSFGRIRILQSLRLGVELDEERVDCPSPCDICAEAGLHLDQDSQS